MVPTATNNDNAHGGVDENDHGDDYNHAIHDNGNTALIPMIAMAMSESDNDGHDGHDDGGE